MWTKPGWAKLVPDHCCSLRVTMAVWAVLVLILMVSFTGNIIFTLRAESDKLAQGLTTFTATVKKTQMEVSDLLQKCQDASKEREVPQVRIIHAVRNVLSRANSVLNPDDVMNRKQSTEEY